MDERVLSQDQIDQELHGLNEWQKWDKKIQSAMPWFVHPFLEVLKTWDLKDKRILEYGGGRSTKWWRHHAKWVDTIETQSRWAQVINADCIDYENGEVKVIDIKDVYTYIRQPYQYDIVIIDGEHRKECLEHWRDQTGITLIADNWDQAHVWIGDGSVQLMKDKKGYIFEQPDHQGENGRNKWKTIYWNL